VTESVPVTSIRKVTFPDGTPEPAKTAYAQKLPADHVGRSIEAFAGCNASPKVPTSSSATPKATIRARVCIHPA